MDTASLYDIKLPDAEMDVLLAIWSVEAPATSPKLMKALGNDRGWKAPTLISFLNRLCDKGLVKSYKNGKERCYTPVVDREEFLQRVTS